LPTGYTSSCTSKCRSKFCKKSGGIIFIYKTELEFFFKFPKNDYQAKKFIHFHQCTNQSKNIENFQEV
jgi:hypothetical protein